MKLAELINESLIFPDLCTPEKTAALRVMVQGICKAFPELKEEDLYSVIMERERLNSTGIGSGIAIPHAKSALCTRHIVAFGRVRSGIPFDAIDEKPVYLIFMIIGPLGANEAHLRSLARISKFLHDTTFRDRLMSAETAQIVYEAILEKDSQD